jgi:hypothetical protein
MALIDPFRKLIVYPSLLRSVRARWNQAFGTADVYTRPPSILSYFFLLTFYFLRLPFSSLRDRAHRLAADFERRALMGQEL